MAETANQSVPTHPIAPRVKNHNKKSHVGPDIQGYRDHHKKTIGEGSDEWWAQVRPFHIYPCLSCTSQRHDRCIHRSQKKLYTGIVHSRPSDPVALRPETSSGSPKVASTPPTTASTDGLTPSPIRFVTSLHLYSHHHLRHRQSISVCVMAASADCPSVPNLSSKISSFSPRHPLS